MEKIFGYMKQADDEELWAFANDIHSLIIDKFFNDFWEDRNDVFVKSNPEAIASLVNSLNPKSVLDVGCGPNKYKNIIKADEYVALDPFHRSADVKTTVIDYHEKNPEKQFDVVMALGSICFGTKEKILAEIEAIDALTASGGTQVWKVNAPYTYVKERNGPSYAELFPLVNLVQVHTWDEQFIRHVAEVYGYEIKSLEEDYNWEGQKRFYFTFYKY